MRVAFWRATSPTDPRWADAISLSFRSLVAHARHCGEEVEPVYCTTADDLVAADADLYGVSSVTGTWPLAVDAIRRVQDAWPGRTVVVGGPHITCLPECRPAGTVAILGEGEPRFSMLCRAINRGYTPPPGEIHPAARMNLALCGHLPVCAETTPGNLMAVASRGCPFQCWFCCAWRCWSRTGSPSVTRFSPETVAQQIGDYFRDRPAGGTVVFHDLTFASSGAWLRDLSIQLAKRGCPEHFRVKGCSFSAAMARPDILNTLSRLGVEWIGVGIESASPRLYRKLKPHLEFSANIELIELARRYGITVNGSFIIGTPGETAEDLQHDYDFLEQYEANGFRQGGLFMFVPYPGTPAWADLSACGTVSAHMDFSALTNGANPDKVRVFYCNPEMPYEEAVEWRRKLSRLCAEKRKGAGDAA